MIDFAVGIVLGALAVLAGVAAGRETARRVVREALAFNPLLPVLPTLDQSQKIQNAAGSADNYVRNDEIPDIPTSHYVDAQRILDAETKRLAAERVLLASRAEGVNLSPEEAEEEAERILMAAGGFGA